MKMGMGRKKEANEIFSLLIYTALILGTLIAIWRIFFVRPVAVLLGADGEMLDNCVLYAKVILIALPFFILQYGFQSFFVTAEKPNLGLAVTVASGVTNIVLDALLVGVFRFGSVGAAVATATSEFIGGFVPLIYFARKTVRCSAFVKPVLTGKHS